MEVLAQIGDKIPTIPVVLLLGGTLGAVVFVCAAVRPGSVVLPLALALFGDYVAWDELRSPYFGEAVVRELGYGYIIGGFLAYNAPLAVAWCAARAFRRRTKNRELKQHNSCVSCGYNLFGNVSGRCPECGTPLSSRE
jgi:hypothetical protein